VYYIIKYKPPLFKIKERKMLTQTITEIQSNIQIGILPLLAAAAPAIIGGGLGLVGAKNQRKQQNKQQEKQIEHDKNMAEISHQNQLDMMRKSIDATSAKEERRRLEEAGLNPALMYGMSGAGGATATAGAGASASNVMQPPVEGITGMGQQLGQVAMQVAQIENIKADTKKKEAEAGNVEEDTVSKGNYNKAITPQVIDAWTDREIATAGSERAKRKMLDLANNFEEWLQTPEGTQNGQSPKERQVRVEINKALATVYNLDATTENEVGAKRTLLGANIKEVNSNVALKEQLKGQLDKINPIEVEQAIKNLEMLKQDPANSKIGQYIDFVTKQLSQTIGVYNAVKGGR